MCNPIGLLSRKALCDVGDGWFRGSRGADQGGRGPPGPVAVAQKVQPWFGDAARRVGRDGSVLGVQAQRREVVQGGAEAGAPDDRVAVECAAVVPGDAAL